MLPKLNELNLGTLTWLHVVCLQPSRAKKTQKSIVGNPKQLGLAGHSPASGPPRLIFWSPTHVYVLVLYTFV